MKKKLTISFEKALSATSYTSSQHPIFSMFEPFSFNIFESLLSSFDHKIENGNLKHVSFERISFKMFTVLANIRNLSAQT